MLILHLMLSNHNVSPCLSDVYFLYTRAMGRLLDVGWYELSVGKSIGTDYTETIVLQHFISNNIGSYVVIL